MAGLPRTPQLDDLVVVLVRPRNPLNIGASARAMSNFGARQLRLVNPYAVGFREARSAVGASLLLKNAKEFNSVADAVSDCSLVVGTTAVRNRALEHPLHRLNEKAGDRVRTALSTGRVAILFGSEKIGLTNEDFSHCHWLLHVPTDEEHISMNLGQAVAVCLYGIAQSVAEEPAQPLPEPAPAGEIEKITEGFYEALKISGYVKPGNDVLSEKKVRRLMRRLHLEAIDAKVFLGMVRQIVWKLRQSSDR